MTRGIKSAMKQLCQESPIERLKETVFTLFAAHPRQLISEIVGVVVEEAFLLDKVTEHEAVEHDAGIPLFVAIVLLFYLVIYTRYKLDES